MEGCKQCSSGTPDSVQSGNKLDLHAPHPPRFRALTKMRTVYHALLECQKSLKDVIAHSKNFCTFGIDLDLIHVIF